MNTFLIRRWYLALACACALFATPVFADEAVPPGAAIATFAGGCFWCMEPPFDKLDGVLSTTVGYTGGTMQNPTYKDVSKGGTGHAESVQITYDPNRISYEKLLDVFWHNVDPTSTGGQFCDWGDQYRSEIFYHTPEQKRLAEQSKANLEKSKPFKEPVVTRITAAGKFWPAEEYHQKYYQKNPLRYKFYRYGCGRDKRLEELWGKPASPH
jgi:peptide-methionine (S)-S-oxide reductase